MFNMSASNRNVIPCVCGLHPGCFKVRIAKKAVEERLEKDGGKWKHQNAWFCCSSHPPRKPNPFGSARPREVVLEEKGIDWKKIDYCMQQPHVYSKTLILSSLCLLTLFDAILCFIHQIQMSSDLWCFS